MSSSTPPAPDSDHRTDADAATLAAYAATIAAQARQIAELEAMLKYQAVQPQADPAAPRDRRFADQAVPVAVAGLPADSAEQGTHRVAEQLERTRLYAEVFAARGRLQQLSLQLLEAQEQERRQIARELHDEVGQSLGALKINLHVLSADTTSAAGQARLTESITLLDELLQQVRRLSLDLRPAVLDDLGLVAALEWYCDRLEQRTGLRAKLIDELHAVPIAPAVATACFRIIQEALTNVVRHAQAQQVVVWLRRHQNLLLLSVSDDGIGFDVPLRRSEAAAGRSLGLLSITERAELAGGRAEICATPGAGAEIWAWLPLLTGATDTQNGPHEVSQ